MVLQSPGLLPAAPHEGRPAACFRVAEAVLSREV